MKRSSYRISTGTQPGLLPTERRFSWIAGGGAYVYRPSTADELNGPLRVLKKRLSITTMKNQ